MTISNDTIEGLARRIALIEDDMALQRLIHSYLSLADGRHWKAWSETFTEDANFDLPNSFGLMRGRQEIYDVCVGKMDGTWKDTQHNIVNTNFCIDGDTATGTGHIIFAAIPAGGEPADVYLMGGRYRWKFSRTAEGWRISDAWEEFFWNNGAAPKVVFEKDSEEIVD